MSHSFNPPPTELPHQTGHETTDVHPPTIGLFGLILVLSVAIVLPLLSWMFWQLEATAKKGDRPFSDVIAEQRFRGPRLQNDPAAELVTFRRNEEQRLSTYAWIDKAQGVVQIPVDRAITLLAERGFPEPSGLADQPATQGEQR